MWTRYSSKDFYSLFVLFYSWSWMQLCECKQSCTCQQTQPTDPEGTSREGWLPACQQGAEPEVTSSAGTLWELTAAMVVGRLSLITAQLPWSLCISLVVCFHIGLWKERQWGASFLRDEICILCLIKARWLMPEDVKMWHRMLFAKCWDFMETWKLINYWILFMISV